MAERADSDSSQQPAQRPSERFEKLARRLLAVRKAEVREAEAREAEKRRAV